MTQQFFIDGRPVLAGSAAHRACCVLDDTGGVLMFLTPFGALKAGPEVKALYDAAKGDAERQEQVYGFVAVWHELEWAKMREPAETP